MTTDDCFYESWMMNRIRAGARVLLIDNKKPQTWKTGFALRLLFLDNDDSWFHRGSVDVNHFCRRDNIGHRFASHVQGATSRR